MNWTPEQVEAHNKRVAEGGPKRARPFIPAEYKQNVLDPVVEMNQSTDEQKLNKTEKRYLEYLRSLNPKWIGIQAITLKLADDCRYTPDFVAIDNLGVIHAREVKGYWRDDARVKIKVAARQFPWMRFTACQWVMGAWKNEEIKP